MVYLPTQLLFSKYHRFILYSYHTEILPTAPVLRIVSAVWSIGSVTARPQGRMHSETRKLATPNKSVDGHSQIDTV